MFQGRKYIIETGSDLVMTLTVQIVSTGEYEIED